MPFAGGVIFIKPSPVSSTEPTLGGEPPPPALFGQPVIPNSAIGATNAAMMSAAALFSAQSLPLEAAELLFKFNFIIYFLLKNDMLFIKEKSINSE